jgi:hypothetical protein
MCNLYYMSKYENIYTKQINDALFDQSGHESKKQVEKEKTLEKNATLKRQIRAIMGFLVVAFLGACAYFISLDPSNAGPAGMAFGAFLVGAFIIWAMNR